MRFIQRLRLALLLTSILSGSSFTQKALAWQEVRNRLEASNPTLPAGPIGMNESRAALSPNPNLTLGADPIDPFPGGPSYGPYCLEIQRGGDASLLDFLNAQADDRSLQVHHLNWVAPYLDAANQLNLAAGGEVIR